MDANKTERIDQVFNLALNIVPEYYGKRDWLIALKSDALNEMTDSWLDQLRAYLRGLWTANVIGIEHIDDFDNGVDRIFRLTED